MKISDRYKRKHRQALLHRIILVCAGVFVLCAILFGLLWIPFFRAQTITTVGTLEPEKINTLIQEHIAGTNTLFIPKNNFFFVDTAGIAEYIQTKNLGVAVVQKQFPSTINIVFPERKARFITCATNDTCYYISDDGLAYSESPQFSEYPLPLIITKLSDSAHINLGDYVADSKNMRYLNVLVAGLSRLGVESKIIEIEVGNQTTAPFAFKEIKLFTPKEWFIYLNTELSPENTLENITLLFDEKIKNDRDKLQYIDMRFENKAFYMVY